MAIPPEPIEEVLPAANAAVLAEVQKVLVQDPQKPAAPHEPDATSVPGEAARQVVALTVKEVLFGDVKAGTTLEVVKPAGDYALREGSHGPFLLKTAGKAIEIVGRYGPDTYSADTIRNAAKRAGKS